MCTLTLLENYYKYRYHTITHKNYTYDEKRANLKKNSITILICSLIVFLFFIGMFSVASFDVFYTVHYYGCTHFGYSNI